MVSRLDPFHARVAAVALEATARQDFALAGGNALAAHGLLDRLTRDIDLFTPLAGATALAAREVSAALRAAGLTVEVEEPLQPGGEFTSLRVRGSGPAEEVLLELGRDARAQRPARIVLAGALSSPVLALEDLVASKVGAMLGRGAARDYLDVAALMTRDLQRYGQRQLLEAAFGRDPGLPAGDVALAMLRLDRMPDRRFTAYGLDMASVSRLRASFEGWSRDPGRSPVAVAAHRAARGSPRPTPKGRSATTP